MVIGSNKHRYHWDSNWAKLPAGKSFGFTHGVVIDSAANVYIFNQSADALCIFDPEGNFIKSWGAEFAAGAHGLYLSKEKGTEYLYLTDYEQHLVRKTTLDGETILQYGLPPRSDIYSGLDQFKPTETCVAPNGDVYIFDGYGQPYVHQYDAGGKYIRSIGGSGKGAGQLICPHAGFVDLRKVASGGQPELYVADRGNDRIQVFTLDGQHKRFITEAQHRPCNFDIYNDELYIPDLHARVTILDKNDHLITHLGENPSAPKTEGWPNIQHTLTPGKFNSPHALRVDSLGNIYVVEWINTGRVTKLTKQP
ncbi:MAG: hypothetical protein IT448_05725 [Phycisphaerales bacterium]|nr:hypothetical protein [Phycisphaerales bacterium]